MWKDVDWNVDFFDVELANNIIEDIEYLKGKLEDKGVTVQDLEIVTITHNTPINEVRNELQKIENNFAKINTNQYESYAWRSRKIIGNIFTKDLVNDSSLRRWVEILNDLHRKLEA